MTRRYRSLLCLLIQGAGIAAAHAQCTASASGGDATGPAGTAAYTVGQPFYMDAAGNAGTSQQGVQQAYVVTSTGITSPSGIRVDVLVAPNPTRSSVQLHVGQGSLKDPRFMLYSADGRLLLTQRITGIETQVPMDDLATGTYLLRVVDGNVEVRNVTIIKTN